MISQKTVQQLQHASVTERIDLIEVLLQSLKYDIQTTHVVKTPQWKPFTVRLFNLGSDIQVDRDVIYAERSLS